VGWGANAELLPRFPAPSGQSKDGRVAPLWRVQCEFRSALELWDLVKQRRRDLGWKRDGKAKGVYWRKLASGKGWGYYHAGKIHSAPSRDAAIEAKAEAQVRKSKGLPEPDSTVTIAKLAEEVRETKRRKLRGSSFGSFEYALDKIILAEIGSLRVVQVGPDRIARLIHDLDRRGLKPSSIRRYLSPLGPIFKLAVRRGNGRTLISSVPRSRFATRGAGRAS
jgi:hypothetical protein